MKIIYYIALYTCFLQSAPFIEKVINDFKSDSSYLTFKIKAADYKGDIVIENDDLYLYYYSTFKKSKEDYQNFIKPYLNKKEVLDIGNQSINKWNFLKVKTDKIVLKNLKKGLTKFIKIYFDKNSVEKGKISAEQKNFIIKILFANNVACHVDDETGLLIINRH